MKGLLLKDAYMAAKYCRAYLLIVAVFLIAAPFSGDNLFLMMYPCILASMVPVNLLAYDAQSKWEQYAGTLPCSRDLRRSRSLPMTISSTIWRRI